jgi:hypothetical protein
MQFVIWLLLSNLPIRRQHFNVRSFEFERYTQSMIKYGRLDWLVRVNWDMDEQI